MSKYPIRDAQFDYNFKGKRYTSPLKVQDAARKKLGDDIKFVPVCAFGIVYSIYRIVNGEDQYLEEKIYYDH